jgi:hypothetical protein
MGENRKFFTFKFCMNNKGRARKKSIGARPRRLGEFMEHVGVFLEHFGAED